MININGKSGRTQYADRAKQDCHPNNKLATTMDYPIVDSAFSVLSINLDEGYLKDYINFLKNLIEQKKYVELQNDILSCEYDPSTYMLTVPPRQVRIYGKVHERVLRLVCFFIEIYRRSADIIMFKNLKSKYTSLGLSYCQFCDVLLEPRMEYGEYKDGIDYYVSGKNPFDRLSFVLSQDLDDIVYH